MAQHRHKRETNARRTTRAVQVAAPLAVIATVSAVTLGVVSASPQDSGAVASSSSAALSSSAASGTAESRLRRDPTVSRSEVRLAGNRAGKARKERRERRERIADRRAAQATARAVRRADTRLWSTTELNLWTGPTEDARNVGLLDALEKVLVTGRRAGGRAEVVVDGQSRWVTAEYLAEHKPEEEPTLGGSCSNGTSVPSGVSSNIVAVHRAVCANFPSITGYGTLRGGGGDHPLGKAVDIMISGAPGWEVANFVRANYAELGVSYVIYAQNIWSVERSGEGWRPMSNRGSVTANHYDHVHVSTY